MPWQPKDLMDTKREFVELALREGANPPRVTMVVASLDSRTPGAAMKDISGTLRTIIQRPGSSSAVAARERSTGVGRKGSWHCIRNTATLERRDSVHARPRAGMDCAGEIAGCDHYIGPI